MSAITHDLAALAPIGPLTDWLDAHVPQLGKGPLHTAILSGGQANVVLTLDRGAGPMVLRRPPAVSPPGAERGVLRESRVLAALAGTAVPHPHCHGVCPDDSVIGAPFYVMEKVAGWAPNLRNGRIHNQPPFDALPHVRDLPFAIIDGLIALAKVNYLAVGLGDFGKPDGFLARQVDRWAGQLASYKLRYGYEGRPLPGLDEIESWLRGHGPSCEVHGIIHGDVGTPNMMFQNAPPARLAAMIDWELSTIGDPMIDLGWFTGSMRDERFPDEVAGSGLNDPALFPTRQELAARYCAGTGRAEMDYDYFLILAAFKSVCLLEYKCAQAAAGHLPQETGRFFADIVDRTLRSTTALVRRLS
jgi:aminoglycoside phosphotransferase (APT) family kinase protein